jgi:hypothetical protein
VPVQQEWTRVHPVHVVVCVLPRPRGRTYYIALDLLCVPARFGSLQDFGLSRMQQATRATMTPEAGTPSYMAPGKCGRHATCYMLHAPTWRQARANAAEDLTDRIRYFGMHACACLVGCAEVR